MEAFQVQGPLGTIKCVVEKDRSAGKQVLIISHGFRGSMESGGYAKSYAVKAAAHSTVIRYNFTGTTKLSLQVAELEAVIAEVRRLRPESRIFLMGRSMGSAASILCASRDSNIAGLVIWSAPNDLTETMDLVLGEDSYRRLLAGETVHLEDERGVCDITPDFLTDYAKLDLLGKYAHWDGRPVLLFHCEGDAVVPVQQARRNQELLGACCEAHIFPGGDHSIALYNEEAGAILASWLQAKNKE